MKKNNNKGFTLAELLIVVAIIAVLTAIAIPVFTTQLEKSREATDQANLRSAYAEQMTKLLTWDGQTAIPDMTVTAKQAQAKWQSASDATSIKIASGIKSGSVDSGVEVGGSPVSPSGTWTVKADTTNMKITITPTN